MPLSLIVLAAGAGARFGGEKQLQAVGPGGQCLFEYSVYDACRAGFDHFIFVVNDALDTDTIARKLTLQLPGIRIDFVTQQLTTRVGNHISQIQLKRRSKPWGTAHAVLVARPFINNMFAVINADDFYGRTTFAGIAQFLRDHDDQHDQSVMPGYLLGNTLSNSGGVNRGVCMLDEQGYLQSIQEVHTIHCDCRGDYHSDAVANNVQLGSTSLVSMTFWGFHPAVLDCMEERFSAFLSSQAGSTDAEFYIPLVVDHAIGTSLLQVSVLPTAEEWMGMTYQDDVAIVAQKLLSLTQAGVYPARFNGS